MPKLLEKAFEQVSRLPESEQDAIAAWLLEELASDRRWDETFAQSEDLLAQLADEALAEYQRGNSQPLDPDTL